MEKVIAVGILAPLMLLGGLFVLYMAIYGMPWRKTIAGEEFESNPLRPYVLQILGLTFILPTLLVMSAVLDLKSEAISALLGGIIAFLFGARPINQSKEKPKNAGDEFRL